MLTERIQALIDRQIGGSPRARALLRELQGHSLDIEARYTPWRVQLTALPDKLTLDRNPQAPGVAAISGSPLSLLARAALHNVVQPLMLAAPLTRAVRQFTPALVGSLRELWHLRAEVFSLVSLQHSQHAADTRLAQLNRHFPSRSPRSGFGALEPRDMWP